MGGGGAVRRPEAQLAIFGADAPALELVARRCPTPIAARTDPATSRAAGRQIRRSGRERSQALEVLEAIQRRPGLTTRELAAAEGLDRYVVARRVSWLEVHGLARRGAARPDRISGRTAEEWYPAEIGGAGGRF